MKRIVMLLLACLCMTALGACGQSAAGGSADEGRQEASAEGTMPRRVKVTVGTTELFADLEDNAATRAWVQTLPVTLPMQNLYGREMCYRYGAGSLPTDGLRSGGYAVGDIAYWPPRGSLVILYRQNGERFERQPMGHIDGDVEAVFSHADTVDVTFSAAD